MCLLELRWVVPRIFILLCCVPVEIHNIKNTNVFNSSSRLNFYYDYYIIKLLQQTSTIASTTNFNNNNNITHKHTRIWARLLHTSTLNKQKVTMYKIALKARANHERNNKCICLTSKWEKLTKSLLFCFT